MRRSQQARNASLAQRPRSGPYGCEWPADDVMQLKLMSCYQKGQAPNVQIANAWAGMGAIDGRVLATASAVA